MKPYVHKHTSLRDHVIILPPQRILSEINYGSSVGGPDDLYFNECNFLYLQFSMEHLWCGNYGLERDSSRLDFTQLIRCLK